MSSAATPAESVAPAGEDRATPLRPVITRPMLTVFVIGDVLGAGIYALVGEVAGETGGAIWTGFLLAGVLAAFTAGSYAELVTKYPQAAGAALYAHKAYKRPFLTFMVAFAVVCSGVASAATLATAFGGDYLAEFVTLPKILVGFGFLALLAAINFRGIKESIRLNLGLTAVELTGLVLVVAIGLVFLLDGGGDASRALEFAEGDAVPLVILSGASLAFFALIGFEDSVNVAEETQEPRKTFPPALFTGLAVALVVYVLVTLIAGMAVPADTLSESDGPLLEVVQLGPLGMSTKVFSAIALFALTNGALINLIMASRLLYGMAQQGVIPRAFGRVHPERRTPWVAILFVTGLAAALVAVGSLETLADTTVLLLLAVFISVNAAVLILRADRVRHDHWSVPTVLPVLGIAASVALILQKAFDDAVVFAYAGGLLAIGLVLSVINRAVAGPPEEIDPAKLVG